MVELVATVDVGHGTKLKVGHGNGGARQRLSAGLVDRSVDSRGPLGMAVQGHRRRQQTEEQSEKFLGICHLDKGNVDSYLRLMFLWSRKKRGLELQKY